MPDLFPIVYIMEAIDLLKYTVNLNTPSLLYCLVWFSLLYCSIRIVHAEFSSKHELETPRLVKFQGKGFWSPIFSCLRNMEHQHNLSKCMCFILDLLLILFWLLILRFPSNNYSALVTHGHWFQVIIIKLYCIIILGD